MSLAYKLLIYGDGRDDLSKANVELNNFASQGWKVISSTSVGDGSFVLFTLECNIPDVQPQKPAPAPVFPTEPNCPSSISWEINGKIYKLAYNNNMERMDRIDRLQEFLFKAANQFSEDDILRNQLTWFGIREYDWLDKAVPTYFPGFPGGIQGYKDILEQIRNKMPVK